MGGHALSQGLTTRKSSLEYYSIKSQILLILSSSSPCSIPSNATAAPPCPPSSSPLPPLSLPPASSLIIFSDLPEPPNKESFGDLDLIYYRHPNVTHLDLQQYLTLLFHPTEMVQSGNVLSFDYQSFQIDFIECAKETFPLMKFCLSYGDRGMLLGQIARWWGFSLSFNGLIVIPEDLEVICGIKGMTEKIILTLDPTEIRLFMNLPLTDDMIQSLDDIGFFCKSSSWYRPEIFTRKLNAEGRKRWAKRPYYRSFIEQIVQETRYHFQTFHEQISSYYLPTSETKYQHLYHHIHPSLLSVITMEGPNPFLSSAISPHFELYSYTSKEVFQEQRLRHIKAALTYFEKWDEVKAIQEKYAALQQRREKLNYHSFIQLGISSHGLIPARNHFIQWLMKQKVRGKEGAGVALDVSNWEDISENDRLRYEEEVLRSETHETIQEKLLLWYEEKQRGEKGSSSDSLSEEVG